MFCLKDLPYGHKIDVGRVSATHFAHECEILQGLKYSVIIVLNPAFFLFGKRNETWLVAIRAHRREII